MALCAAASGGLWYGRNLWRYGTPVAPFVFGASGTTLDAGVIGGFVNAYGVGRSPLTFFLPRPGFLSSPSGSADGRIWYNPFVYAGLAGLLFSSARRRHGPLFFTAVRSP